MHICLGPIIEFSSPEEATGVMVKTGLIEREMYRLTSGTATVNVAIKDARNRLLGFHANLNRPLKKRCRILPAGGLGVSPNFKSLPRLGD